MSFQYNDGGRLAAGFHGTAGDCVVRAIAIASGLGYQVVYDDINRLAQNERGAKKSNARNGVFTGKRWFKDYLIGLGWRWTPTMQIGSGCKVHLRADELPAGTLIVAVSKHMVAVIDGTIHDLYDPSRNGTRCVYGYWSKGGAS